MQFKDIPVSTQTFTVRTNVHFTDLNDLFASLEPNDDLVIIKYKDQFKGEPVVKKTVRKSRKSKTPGRKNFLNCITIVVVLDKRINVKIFKNGVFQLTGCKSVDHAKDSIHKIFQHLEHLVDFFELDDDAQDFVFYFKSAMRNIDFELGYKINRNSLANYLHTHTHYSIPPISSTNMGVKIKIPINIEDLPVTKVNYKDYPNQEVLAFGDCFEILTTMPCERINKMSKFVSISVFQNGKVTISCADAIYQEKYFNWFMELMNDAKSSVMNPEVIKKTFRMVS